MTTIVRKSYSSVELKMRWPWLINLIPYAALAAILIYTGYRMCEPVLWRHVAHIGREQLESVP